MAIKTVTVGPGKLTIGADADLTAFESQVTSCTLVPKVDNGDQIYVLSGEGVPGDRSEEWTLEGDVLQDFGHQDGRVEWLFAHRGQLHPFTYVPNSKLGRQITGTLQVEAVDIGGDVNSKPTSKFEFRLSGEPVIGAVPTPAP